MPWFMTYIQRKTKVLKVDNSTLYLYAQRGILGVVGTWYKDVLSAMFPLKDSVFTLSTGRLLRDSLVRLTIDRFSKLHKTPDRNV